MKTRRVTMAGATCLRRAGATRVVGQGVPGRQAQVYSQDSQRNPQPPRICPISSPNAPQFGHCAIWVNAR